MPEPTSSPLTVAVPTMNGMAHLPDLIAGLRSQEAVAFDWLFCDDRSDDQSVELIQGLVGDRANIVVNPERLGLARNWNRCVALCKTPYIAIIHQDDVPRADHLASHLRVLESDPTIGLVASASEVIDGQGQAVPESVVGRGGLGDQDLRFAPREALEFLAPCNPFRCSAVSLRVAAHASVGGFDPALKYVVDWDFWCRVAARWPVAWLARPTVDIRWHPASETHRFQSGASDLEETERVFHSLLAQLEIPEAAKRRVAKAAHHGMARGYLNRAYIAARGGDGPLSRRCLGRALRLWPGIAGTIAADPRLAVRLASACAAPSIAGRWLSRRELPL